MATVRGRGRGGSTGGSGAGGRGGGPDGANIRRGSWRGGPPGSAGYNSRGQSPSLGGSGAGSPAPRQSINDHMNEIKRIPGDKPQKTFQTDTDISATGRSPAPAERELKPWQPDTSSSSTNSSSTPSKASTAAPLSVASSSPASRPNGTPRDAETFGGAAAAAWDQFEANARLFGTKTSYQEELYTTKLNRGGADYRKREKEAERLANEIMGQTASNPHLAEERNQVVDDWTKDEEEKYSGVQRHPNAYVPPAARRAAGAGAAAGRPPPAPASATVSTPKANGGGYAAAAKGPGPAAAAFEPPTAASDAAKLKSEPDAKQTPVPSQPAEKASSDNKAASTPQPPTQPQAKAPSPLPSVAAPADGEVKDGQQISTVVDSFRQFVGTERERVEAKKQSIQKSERERAILELKKFQQSFKVPMPMPKDILPILSKDQEKQKAMEARALETAKAAKSPPPPAKSALTTSPLEHPKPQPPKKIAMKIQDIPPFNPAKRQQPLQVPVPDTITAGQSVVPLAISPSPSAASAQAEGSQAEREKAAKLNPNANSFVFKPNPGAASFKPGQSSTGSPAARPAQIQSASPAAGPSVPKNPFFREGPPQRIDSVHPREDFNPWKHGQVPSAASVSPQWPFTGRKYHTTFSPGPPMHPMGMPPMGGMVPSPYDDDPNSPHGGGPPPLMQGMPPNFPPYYRFQQSPMLPQGMQSPMFSPGPGYAPLPGQGMGGHMGGGGPQPNGMPIYFQNGMPQQPHFVPQHMQFNPNSPHRGPGPGGPGGGGPAAPMYGYGGGMQISTPQQTPQMHHNALQPPMPGAPYHSSPMQSQGSLGGGPLPIPGPGPGPGGFDGPGSLGGGGGVVH